MRRPRYFPANCVYEVSLRVREGLPFAPKQVIELLLKSAMARTQRDFKVTLCHFVWMGNHAHILVVGQDAERLTAYYAEVQKKITDYLKRLLGRRQLSLWETRPSVILVADYEAALNRIAYFYANPARAHLIDTIELYPGLSSYQIFSTAPHKVTHSISETIPWLRCPSIPEVPSRDLSEKQDNRICALLKETNKKLEELTVKPHYWLTCFNTRSPEMVKEASERVMEKLRAHELDAREQRAARGLSPRGRKRLLQTPLMLEHTPKKYSRRIFIITTCNELRISYIKHVDVIWDQCRECYQRWKQRDYNFIWPPGTFPPCYPMSANVLGIG